MIRLSQVSVSSRRRGRVIQGVSLHLPDDSVGFLAGPMGAGKSLILRLCAGELLPDDGHVVVMPSSSFRRAGAAVSGTTRSNAMNTVRPASASIGSSTGLHAS